MPTFTALRWILNFYPRPPRGGRPSRPTCLPQSAQFLSTPSARRATGIDRQGYVDTVFLSTPSARRATSGLISFILRFLISIHALREEGDLTIPWYLRGEMDFYPRPPRGGRQFLPVFPEQPIGFLSTPSARRATLRFVCRCCCFGYFYPRPPRGGRHTGLTIEQEAKVISIHALREEGDVVVVVVGTVEKLFLSTPSARRATE